MIKLIIGSTKISFHSPQSELEHRARLRAKAAELRAFGHEVDFYDDGQIRYYYLRFADESEAALFKLTHL